MPAFRPPTPALIAVAFLTLMSTACGSGDAASAGAEWEVVRDTVGDTMVVHTVSGSLWGDTATLVPEITIGVFDGDEEYMFGGIASLSVAPDGTIYVMDRQVPALRVYNADGTYRTTLGREGSGPGEYTQPDGGLSVLSDGRVLLRDPGNARINVYSPEGESIDTWPIRGGFNTSNPLFVDENDNAYTQLLIEPDADVSDWVIGLRMIRPDGTSGDTLVPPETNFEAPFIEARTENSVSRNSVPFSPNDHVEFSPLGYYVVGISTDYAFTLYRSNEPPLKISRSYEPVPVQGAEKSWARERSSRNMRNMIPSWRWNGPEIPDLKPPFSGLTLAQDGRIWVQVSLPGVEEENPNYDPDSEGSQPTRWTQATLFDVFEPTGEYLGAVRVNEALSSYPNPYIRGDFLWGVVTDELGVQRVARFRIDRPATTP